MLSTNNTWFFWSTRVFTFLQRSELSLKLHSFANREEIHLGEFLSSLRHWSRHRDGGSSSSVGEDANGGRGMINYSCRGSSESTRARAIEKERKKKTNSSLERRRVGSSDGALANCALKWWKIGERVRGCTTK